MCGSLRRANMGGEYCLLFPIKPQRIKEHSPPPLQHPLLWCPPPTPPRFSLRVILWAGNAGRLWDQRRSQVQNTDQGRGELMPRLFSIPNWPLARNPCAVTAPLSPLKPDSTIILFSDSVRTAVLVMSELNHGSSHRFCLSAAGLATIWNSCEPLWFVLFYSTPSALLPVHTHPPVSQRKESSQVQQTLTRAAV